MSHVCASDDDKKAGRGHLIRTKAMEMLLFFLQILIRLVKKYKQDADQKNICVNSKVFLSRHLAFTF